MSKSKNLENKMSKIKIPKIKYRKWKMPKIQISKTKMTHIFDENASKKSNISENRDLSRSSFFFTLTHLLTIPHLTPSPTRFHLHITVISVFHTFIFDIFHFGHFLLSMTAECATFTLISTF
jgi:hypothetical protein